MAHSFPFIKPEIARPTPEELLQRSLTFYEFMNRRRSIRHFSDRPVAEAVMIHLIMTASTAPSGAHKQPWTFCLVGDPEMKKKIRVEAEKEEYESYHGRMSEEWMEDLAPLQTDWQKPFLETAPWLIVVFRRIYERVQGKKRQNYYVQESVGIACGFLLAAIHQAGLCALTHTPSPMNFLSDKLNRPENEKPFLLIPVGYADHACRVPDLKRKSVSEVLVRY